MCWQATTTTTAFKASASDRLDTNQLPGCEEAREAETTPSRGETSEISWNLATSGDEDAVVPLQSLGSRCSPSSISVPTERQLR